MKKKFILCLIILCLLPACTALTKKPEVVEIKPAEEYYYHTVQYSGETLGIISAWYTGKTSNWKLIREANPFLDPYKIKIGDKIKIPKYLLKREAPLPFSFIKKFIKHQLDLLKKKKKEGEKKEEKKNSAENNTISFTAKTKENRENKEKQEASSSSSAAIVSQAATTNTSQSSAKSQEKDYQKVREKLWKELFEDKE
ncbi:MAG: LysM peptidoglycan-binding domain-containing protein [Candidatus Dadabacteria bacterium]|nr:MAG: LysM peptidoglycan-binding domain-containing protein [Candidatus Dadabacteria bacterium]